MVNLTISNGDSRTMNFFSNTTHGQLAVATTPSSFAANVISPIRFEWNVNQENPVKIVADLRDMNGNMMTMKQPRVITQCSDTISGFQNLDTNPLYYNFRTLRFFYPQFNFTVPKAVFQDSLDYGTRLGFIDVNEYLPDSINTSVAIWTRGPYGDSLDICLVDARWVATDAWILPLNAGSKIEHSLTINTNQTTTYENVSNTGDDLIRIDPAWVNLLNHSIDRDAFAPTASEAQSTFNLLMEYIGNGYGGHSIDLASGLIIILTAALSTVSGGRP